MTYDEFKKKYNGKFVDYDGQYGAQCWDLGEYYFTKVLKLPANVLAGCGLVSNMLYNPKRKQLDKYLTEVKTPEKGDVAIWEYGHIAIFDHKTGNTKYYFSQNPNAAKVMKITTGGVHFFRLKSKVKTTTTKTPTTTNYYKKCSSKYVSIVDALNSIGVNSSFTYRKKIAKANGIKAYIGTAKQNTNMLKLLKNGKLKKA